MARAIELSDRARLLRYFQLLDERERIRRQIGREGRTVAGSRGQLAPHPLFGRLGAIDTALDRIEETFGASPLARLRLGISAATAHLTLTEMNAALRADIAAGNIVDGPDPRLPEGEE